LDIIFDQKYIITSQYYLSYPLLFIRQAVSGFGHFRGLRIFGKYEKLSGDRKRGY
jgi:hypothetical protein